MDAFFLSYRYTKTRPDDQSGRVLIRVSCGEKRRVDSAEVSLNSPTTCTQLFSVLVVKTRILVLGLETELLGEFGEAGPSVVLFETAATAAALVGRTVGALVGGSPESNELIQTITHAGGSAGKALNQTNGVAGVVALGIVPTEDGHGDFLNGEQNVTDSTAKLAGGGVLRCRRSLNVGIRCAGECEKKCRKE